MKHKFSVAQTQRCFARCYELQRIISLRLYYAIFVQFSFLLSTLNLLSDVQLPVENEESHVVLALCVFVCAAIFLSIKTVV